MIFALCPNWSQRRSDSCGIFSQVSRATRQRRSTLPRCWSRLGDGFIRIWVTAEYFPLRLWGYAAKKGGYELLTRKGITQPNLSDLNIGICWISLVLGHFGHITANFLGLVISDFESFHLRRMAEKVSPHGQIFIPFGYGAKTYSAIFCVDEHPFPDSYLRVILG